MRNAQVYRSCRFPPGVWLQYEFLRPIQITHDARAGRIKELVNL
jgi:hypothetical protein